MEESHCVLLQSIAAGDEAACTRFFLSWRKQVAQWCAAFGAEDIEAATSEVLYRSMCAAKRFRGNDHDVAPWLFTIAKNLARDDLRRRSRRPNFSSRLDDHAHPAHHDLDVLELSHVRAALAALTLAQREVVVARLVLDLSVQDTALLTNRNEGSVKALTKRGVENLRLALEREGHIDLYSLSLLALCTAHILRR